MKDLHLHTNHSDGRISVSELLVKVEKAKLTTISITDHNTVGAYKELDDPNVRKLFSGKIIPGIELEFEYGGVKNELLGYDFDLQKMEQVGFLQHEVLLERENQFLEKLYKACIKHGINLDSLDELMEINKTKLDGYNVIVSNWQKNEQVNKKNNAKLGIFSRLDRKKFWKQNIVGPWTTKQRENMESVSSAIRDAGGLAFMAHIFRASNPKEMLDHAIANRLIDGIEVDYSNEDGYHTPEHIKYLEGLCKKHNLHRSGGSDSHYPADKLASINRHYKWCDGAKDYAK